MNPCGAARRLQRFACRRRIARSRVGIAASVALVATLLPATNATSADAQTTSPSGTAKVSVNFQKPQGALPRPEQFNQFTRRTLFPDQRASDVAYLKSQGVHGAVQRVWIDPMVCQLSTTSCTLTDDVNAYLKAASDSADSILAQMRVSDLVDPNRTALAAVYGTAAAGTGTMTPEQVQPIVKRILMAVKAKYPKLTYVEAMNEPDAPDSRKYMTPASVYPYYRAVERAVNDVNATLEPKVRLRVGGPAFFQFDETWFGKFLDDYAADTDPAKRLDFFSYHAYLEFADKTNLTNPEFYKDNPSQVAGQRAALVKMFRARHLDPKIPSFITESGMYPGPLFDDPSTGATEPCPPTQYEAGIPDCTTYYTTDYVRQSAGMASLQYWYGQEPDTTLFNWTTRQSSNSRKDEFVSRVPEGQQIPTDTLTPYGNLLVMQAKMKTTRVAATTDSLTNGIGVYALAAMDNTGASVMVWNYQGCGAAAVGDPCPNNRAYQATIDMNHLPANLTGHTVRERVFRIDQNTSNYYSTPATDPAHANLQQVDSKAIKPGSSYSESTDLEPNAVYLILLERQHSG
jgi:hypothetical protein